MATSIFGAVPPGIQTQDNSADTSMAGVTAPAVVGNFSVPGTSDPVGGNFGFYAKSLESSQQATIVVKEIYGDVVGDPIGGAVDAANFDIVSRYWFTSKSFLNSIIHNLSRPHYEILWQAFPQVRGFKIYDVQNSTSPIYPQTAFLFPHMYGALANTIGTNEYQDLLGPVVVSDTVFSELLSTPFRSKFAVVNNANELVLLNSQYDQTVNPIQIMSRFQELTQERIIDRVIDPNYNKNSVEIQTKWLASPTDVNVLLDLLSKSINTFYTTIDINIFGNPLVQVGDFAKLTYGLKRMGYDPSNPTDPTVLPLNCLVTSVNQRYDQGFQSTALTLKPLITS